MSAPVARARLAGFTVVEMIVAFLVVVIVILMAWQFFVLERRRYQVDHSRLSGLQGALEMDETLAWDLERIALDLPDRGPVFTVDEPVSITPGRSLEFRMFAEDDRGSLDVPVVSVVYRFDPATGRVLRSTGGKERAFPGLLAEEVQFSLVRVAPILPAVTEPSSFTFGRDVPIHLVKYVLTCFSEGVAAGSDKQVREKVTLVGSVALPFRSDRAYHPYWRAGRAELVKLK